MAGASKNKEVEDAPQEERRVSKSSKYAKVKRWKQKKKNKKKRHSKNNPSQDHKQNDEHDDSNSSSQGGLITKDAKTAVHHPLSTDREEQNGLPKRTLTRTHSKRCRSSLNTSDPQLNKQQSQSSLSSIPPHHRRQLNRAPSVKKHRQRGRGITKILKKKLRHKDERLHKSEPMPERITLMTTEEMHQLYHEKGQSNREGQHVHATKLSGSASASAPSHPHSGPSSLPPAAQPTTPIYNEYYPYTKTDNTNNMHTTSANTILTCKSDESCNRSASAPPTTQLCLQLNKHHQKRRAATIVGASITGTPGWATRSVIPGPTTLIPPDLTTTQNGGDHANFTPKKIASDSSSNGGYQKTIVNKIQSNEVAPPPPPVTSSSLLKNSNNSRPPPIVRRNSNASQSSLLSYASDKISLYTPTKKVCFSFSDEVVHQPHDPNDEEEEEEEDKAYLAHLCCKIPENTLLKGLRRSTLLWQSVKDVCPPATNIEIDPRWQIFDIFRSLRKSDSKPDVLYTSFYESLSEFSHDDFLEKKNGTSSTSGSGSSSNGEIVGFNVASERSVENGAIERFAMQFGDSENLIPPQRKRDISLELEALINDRGGSNDRNGKINSLASASLKRSRKQIGRGNLVASTMDSFAHEDDDLIAEEEDWEGEHWKKLESLAKSSRNLLQYSNDSSNGSMDSIDDGPPPPPPVKKDLASFFTVWRPTSEDAIHKLMDGVAVGKALNIKGKSAKCGRLSGYVPFVQIHENGDINKCCTPCRDSNTRIYFKSDQARVIAVKELEMVLDEMIHKCAWAQEVLQAEEDGWETVEEEEDDDNGDEVGEHDDVSGDESIQHPFLSYMSNQLWGGQPRNPGTNLQTGLTRGNGSSEIDFEMSTRTDFFSACSKEEEELENGNQEGLERTVYYWGDLEEELDQGGEEKKMPFSSAPPPPQPARQTTTDNRLTSFNPEEEEIEEALSTIAKWEMIEPQIILLDHCRDSYGVEVPERLLWETYVRRGDIKREVGSDLETGRPSEPAFMDLNVHAMREQKEGTPRAVIWQIDDDCPLDPRTLLVAYEEEGRVKPVASDFDAFLIGTKGVNFAPLDKDQMDVLQWQVKQIKRLLEAGPSTKGWTSRWFEILREESDRGFHPESPPYGYGDRVSYAIVDKAVWKLRNTGAVRHGPESFNFYAPQEIDSHFLVVSDHFGSVPWMYLSANDLREFLAMRIEEGFVFPMNVKWALCDQGWYDIWKSLLKSEDCQQAMNSWFPPESGLREEIQAIHEAHPEGFVRLKEPAIPGLGVISEEDLDPDIAALELKRHITLRRVKRKLRAILLLMGKI